jgi:hypothetical protein
MFLRFFGICLIRLGIGNGNFAYPFDSKDFIAARLIPFRFGSQALPSF